MEFVCAESFNDMVKKKIHLFNGDFNSDRAIDDVVALYQDFYMAAQMRRSAYDPYLASNINDQFRGKSIDILKGVGVIKTFIPEGAIIVPNHTTFQMWHKYKQKYPFYENSYVDFSIKMIRSNRSIVVYTDLLSDEIKEYVQAASPYVPGNIASLSFEDLPLFEEMNSMNEYRCYNTDFLRRQSLSIETYLLEIYEDVLPRLWGRDDIKSFYPYFKDQDLTTNLVTPQN
jgi:hypothetical protein